MSDTHSGLPHRDTKMNCTLRRIFAISVVLILTLSVALSPISAADVTADKIIIEKKERRLTILLKGQHIRIFRVALGKNPEGPKEREGDNKTPEGVYSIDSRNIKSGYHKSLHISYPSIKDINHAKELGVSPGGNIMIHGIKNGFGWIGDFHRWLDWTQGCIAITNNEMDDLWSLVPLGTTIEIKP